MSPRCVVKPVPWAFRPSPGPDRTATHPGCDPLVVEAGRPVDERLGFEILTHDQAGQRGSVRLRAPSSQPGEVGGKLPEAAGPVDIVGLGAGLDRVALAEELPTDTLDRRIDRHEHE